MIPFGLTMVMFVWGAIIFFDIHNPPEDALEISIVGRQWMWKVQHPTGQSEINELHVPVAQPVKLMMTSEDVIHDVYLSRRFASNKTCSRGVIPVSGSRRPKAGRLSTILRRILRHPAFGDDRTGGGAWNRPSSRSGSAAVRRACPWSIRAQVFSKDSAVKRAIGPAGPTRGLRSSASSEKQSNFKVEAT